MESDDDGKDYNNTLYVFQNGACVSEWPDPPPPPHDSPEILHTRMYNAGIGRSHSELKGDFDVSFRRAASWQLCFFEFGLFAFSV
jgi:hypothetical protein